VLSAVAFVLAQRSRARVTLVGHSDDTGDAAADTRRSLERAQLAETYLAGLGVARSRVTVRGVGTQDPAVDGDSPEADVANRRLEVRGGS
jgi:OOP family OmpA-OmpF porin